MNTSSMDVYVNDIPLDAIRYVLSENVETHNKYQYLEITKALRKVTLTLELYKDLAPSNNDISRESILIARTNMVISLTYCHI